MRFFALTIILFSCYLSTAQVGVNTTNVDASAMLEIEAQDKGVLMPQVSLQNTSDTATITNPAASLLVFNTNTANDVWPGYYYWDGSLWRRFITEYESSIKTRNTTETDINNFIEAPIMGAVEWNDDASLYSIGYRRINVARGGVYRIEFNIHFENSKEYTNPSAQLKINNTYVGPRVANMAQTTKNAGNPGGTLSLVYTVNLNAGDSVRVQMRRESDKDSDKDMQRINGVGTSYIIVTKLK